MTLIWIDNNFTLNKISSDTLEMSINYYQPIYIVNSTVI